jgi:two-component system, OmpR family, response regulator
MKILVVEDDREAANWLVKGLTEEGYVVDHVANGPDGLAMAREQSHDVIVMDRMLPGMDGLSVISRMRHDKISTPVLILSALGEVDDKVVGLRAGGDDYLAKPYAFNELLARVETLARRKSAEPHKTRLQVGDLEIDLLARTARRANEDILLQPREFKLLEYLMRNAGSVVTRTMLLENVWNYHFDPQTNVIDVHISRLRSKIDKDFDEPLLHTVRGAGYTIRGTES